MLIEAAATRVHETPNATMTTYAAPSLGSSELAVWRVEMKPGSGGPPYSADHEQVWVVLEGEATITLDGEALRARPGDAVVLPATAKRVIEAPAGLIALVATAAGCAVSTDQGRRTLPWAA